MLFIACSVALNKAVFMANNQCYVNTGVVNCKIIVLIIIINLIII